MSLLCFPSAGVSFYHNSTPFSKLFGEQARAPGWEARLGAGSPRERQLGARSCEDVSGETGRTTSRAAARSPEFRGCLRRNGPDHLARGTSEPQICEDVSSETAQTTSRAASRSSEFRGCLRRNGPDQLSRGSSELSFRRMSQAKRPIPHNTETRVVRMSQAKRPGPPDFVEDVSAPRSLGRNKLLSQQHPVSTAVWGKM